MNKESYYEKEIEDLYEAFDIQNDVQVVMNADGTYSVLG